MLFFYQLIKNHKVKIKICINYLSCFFIYEMIDFLFFAYDSFFVLFSLILSYSSFLFYIIQNGFFLMVLKSYNNLFQ